MVSPFDNTARAADSHLLGNSGQIHRYGL